MKKKRKKEEIGMEKGVEKLERDKMRKWRDKKKERSWVIRRKDEKYRNGQEKGMMKDEEKKEKKRKNKDEIRERKERRETAQDGRHKILLKFFYLIFCSFFSKIEERIFP